MDEKQIPVLIGFGVVLIGCIILVVSELHNQKQQDFKVRFEPSVTTTITELSQMEVTSLAQGTQQITIFSETTTIAEISQIVPDYNLNTASASDLCLVSGIGEVLANNIITYRTYIGGFCRRSELLQVDGIGVVLAERIMELFYIPNELPPEEPVQTTPKETPIETDVPQITDMPYSSDVPIETTMTHAVMYELNHVTKEELMLIPAMTERIADDIIELRERIGCFQNIHELLLVSGVDGKYFSYTLQDYLYLESVESESILQ